MFNLRDFKASTAITLDDLPVLRDERRDFQGLRSALRFFCVIFLRNRPTVYLKEHEQRDRQSNRGIGADKNAPDQRNREALYDLSTKKYKASKANKVVTDVITVRANVSLIDRLKSSMSDRRL